MNRIEAGVLTENDNGTYTFRYDDVYYSSPAYSAISLTLPKTQQEYHAATLFPFFSNMLSEGVNRRVQSRKWRIDEEDDFGLLAATAGGDAIGAITVERVER
jgi:serine/threonine-protein kinase HipA